MQHRLPSVAAAVLPVGIAGRTGPAPASAPAHAHTPGVILRELIPPQAHPSGSRAPISPPRDRPG
ncbi:hypothetical protein M2266_002978 [Streptomyces sp. SPB162]|nr:hypothetical protein [Streptomyces sp. SPB162]